MYWNHYPTYALLYQTAININMRCIEIHIQNNHPTNKQQININMRCIEMNQSERFWCNEPMININMRCIEIILVHYSLLIVAGLTLTWDVLKSNVSSLVPSFRLGININMRCIEIKLTEWQQTDCRRLTLTWDVLKL